MPVPSSIPAMPLDFIRNYPDELQATLAALPIEQMGDIVAALLCTLTKPMILPGAEHTCESGGLPAALRERVWIQANGLESIGGWSSARSPG